MGAAKFCGRKSAIEIRKTCNALSLFELVSMFNVLLSIFFLFMDCIFWNICGLGRIEKRKTMTKVVKKFKPSFLFLQESKVWVQGYRLVNTLGVAPRVSTRRPVLRWDELVLDRFMEEIQKTKVMKSCLDSLVWSYAPSGLFSVRSFSKECDSWSFEVLSSNSDSLVWCGMVPPKVDIFLWMIAKCRLLVGELLPKFTSEMVSNQLCSFCKKV
ncbi:hypothetical protein QYF36_019019 [Acer negundo]|nr:hypothetical protein QYF36_019019 [Acer negundo]